MSQTLTAEQWAERRALERIPTTLRAKVFPRPGAEPLDCTITDFNDRGARLNLGGFPAAGDDLIVVVWSTGLAFEALTMWRHGGDAGVRFISRCDFRCRVPSRFLSAKGIWLKTRPKLRRPERLSRAAMLERA